MSTAWSMPPRPWRITGKRCVAVVALLLIIGAVGPSDSTSAAIAICGINWYQRHLSGRIPCVRCRHEETCSAYCKRAIAEDGFFRGSCRGFRRVASCR